MLCKHARRVDTKKYIDRLAPILAWHPFRRVVHVILVDMGSWALQGRQPIYRATHIFMTALAAEIASRQRLSWWSFNN